jgi:hypothetical protein
MSPRVFKGRLSLLSQIIQIKRPLSLRERARESEARVREYKIKQLLFI